MYISIVSLPFDFFIPYIALYAETHFRFFNFFPSLLFKRQPEVIFDLPRRLDPGMDLPVALIVNDIRRFPAQLADCSISISKPESPSQRYDFQNITEFEVHHPLQNYMKVFMFRIPRIKLSRGMIYVNARISIKCGRTKRIVINDNLPTTSKLPFSCYISDEVLPGNEFCAYGDVHTHSQYSQSHVEFGPPLAVIDTIAKSSGLTFVAVTDHSYDLDCSVSDYLQPDPERGRWRLFRDECTTPGVFSTIVIPGEEVSCLNCKNEVVHLCGLNLRDYLPGNLDGARKGRHTSRQLWLPEAVEAIHRQGGIAFAAHPGVRMGFMQRLFLERGNWSRRDFECNLDGMQILNNGISPSFERGKELWIQMLQRGIKVPLLAGNDAHGDFNRYRAISLPFLSIGDNPFRYMGYGKTGIYGKRSSAMELGVGIKEGATFITTGPYLSIGLSESFADSIISKQPVDRSATGLFVNGLSTHEFGRIIKIIVMGGKVGRPDETLFFSRIYTNEKYFAHEKIDLGGPVEESSYLRAEMTCSLPDSQTVTRAFTSAVYRS